MLQTCYYQSYCTGWVREPQLIRRLSCVCRKHKHKPYSILLILTVWLCLSLPFVSLFHCWQCLTPLIIDWKANIFFQHVSIRYDFDCCYYQQNTLRLRRKQARSHTVTHTQTRQFWCSSCRYLGSCSAVWSNPHSNVTNVTHFINKIKWKNT